MSIRLHLIVAALALASAAHARVPAPDVVVRASAETLVQGEIPSDIAPVATVKPGQVVRIETIGGVPANPAVDLAAAGIPPEQILPEMVEAARNRKADLAPHFLTGPIRIEGAEPGDMLEVRILAVEPRVPYGVNRPGPRGVAPTILKTQTNKHIDFDMDRRVALVAPGVEVPLAPFMGIMAVAPPAPHVRVGSRPPGVFGGNLDFKGLVAGSTLYLPVFRDGALFVTGDSHGAQGDGEVDGTAIEASMAPTFVFVVHKGAGQAMTAPYAEDADNFYLFGLDPDLDVALRKAVEETVKFLQARYGLRAADAYATASVGVDFAIAEAVDETLAVYGRVPKALFKQKAAYWTAK